MPRDLNSKISEVTFEDMVTGEYLTVEYEMATSDEHIGYTNGAVTRQGNKIVSTLGELRMKAGFKKLRGFRTGDFKAPVKNAVSSHPDDPNYKPGWKQIVRDFYPDVIEKLAIHIFEASLKTVALPEAGSFNDPLTAEGDMWKEPSPAGDSPEGAPENTAAGDEVGDRSPLS